MIKPPIYELGSPFYDEVQAAPFPMGKLRYRNQSAAAEVGLENISDIEWKERFCHFKAFEGNLEKPLALRYHGHQFLNYNPELGDGRGFLFAQFQDKNSRWLDLGTKGSGTTPYSRQGDGRLTLKGAYREILATELLQSLGVNTSKTLSVFETGENLIRYDEPSPTRSAVLVRLGHSHIRFGSFQRLAFLNQKENLKQLIFYVIKNYYPELHQEGMTASDLSMTQVTLLYKQIIQKSAQLVAEWMMTGFVHGVMNTDNMNINGESFDYGPYRFLPRYDIRFTAAYFDQQGLYCFGRQPITMVWNLEQLGKSFEFAFEGFPYKELLEDFADDFNEATQRVFLTRLNLKPIKPNTSESFENIQKLIHHFFLFLEKSGGLYEQLFFDLHSKSERWKNSPELEKYKTPEFIELFNYLGDFEIENQEKAKHPYFAKNKPCTLLIEEIEDIWKPIAEHDDWSIFETKLEEIRSFRGLYSY